MSAINEFVSSMSRAGGFARTSKYAVVITPPASLKQLASESNVAGPAGSRSTPANPNASNMQELTTQVGAQVNLHCSSVSLPGHDLQAQDVQHGSAPGRQMVTSHDYNGTIAASFYLDSHLRERHFFEMWMKMAVSIHTHKANYYDDYIGSMEIYQLDGNNEITYAIKATEVYPTTIAGIEYSYANANAIATQSVNFQYRQWFNMTTKSITAHTRSSIQDSVARQQERLRQRSVLDEANIRDRTSSIKKEKDRQVRLKKLEIDRQGRNMRSAQIERARQKHLRQPNVDTGNSSTANRIARDAIARGLGYESAAALKTALRNKSKGL